MSFEILTELEIRRLNAGTIMPFVENFLTGRLIYSTARKTYKTNLDFMIVKKGKYYYKA